MSDFAPGQRWLSEPEAELGLGIVKETDHRLVTVYFPATDQQRIYSRQNAPLIRIRWHAGETINTVTGDKLCVAAVETLGNTLIYMSFTPDSPHDITPVPESLIDHHLELTSAPDRLFSGQLDAPRWFELRHQALLAREYALGTPARGLAGARIDLIPHQLYIAHEVSRRHAPRVLLADEVGLGKTIEAGLILHRLILTHQVQRALIIVPEALIHQWFVEMIRRFNLHFSIYDHERIAALQAEHLAEDSLSGSQPDHNPFMNDQFVLCSTRFLADCDVGLLLEGHWDILVVDESHHFQWSPDAPSAGYLRLEQLARNTPALLLLTATPEQAGMESHFAQLRLLDPQRFHSLEAFRKEQLDYQPLAELAGTLHGQPSWNETLRNQVTSFLPGTSLDESSPDEIARELLDRNGTGRVLFRNTRQNISGFPQRNPDIILIEPPAGYVAVTRLATLAGDTDLLLHPELGSDDDRWCETDGRLQWLASFLRQHREEKVLAICAHKETAMAVQSWLAYHQSFQAAVFHEDMDLIARDRAAAWFADHEDGAQILVCSEIGSEGRNFQFARHLVLLDLPLNPDVLEQRIGRLDRIGQGDSIHIHVTCFAPHPQHVLLRWYHDSMNAFRTPNAIGHMLLEQCEPLLKEALFHPDDEERLRILLDATQTLAGDLQEQMRAGRNRLLELTSFDREKAQDLIEEIRILDDRSPFDFLECIFENLEIATEYSGEHRMALQPSDQSPFLLPGLPEDGLTVTTDRQTALGHDDVAFLTWEHPMVTGAIDLVLGLDQGKACVALLRNPRLPAGAILMETLYALQVMAPRALNAERFLPPVMIRVLTNTSGKDMSDNITHEAVSRHLEKIDRGLANKIIRSQASALQEMLDTAAQHAQRRAGKLVSGALEKMRKHQTLEQRRLEALARRNPNIRAEELEVIAQQTRELEDCMTGAKPQLEAIRVIVTTQ